MQCALGTKQHRKIEEFLGRTVVSCLSRGGRGNNLVVWLDKKNADFVYRNSEKRPYKSEPYIRNGQFVNREENVVNKPVPWTQERIESAVKTVLGK